MCRVPKLPVLVRLYLLRKLCTYRRSTGCRSFSFPLAMVEASPMAKSAVLFARIAFCLLGCVTFFIVLYTCITDGTPFRKDILTPWMKATLVDFYVNVAAIAIWVCYKEESWISALVWTVLLICFGSMTTCWYITIELFKLSPQDPIYLILLKNHHSRIRFNQIADNS